MNCAYVRGYYGVPACIGRTIEHHGRPGVIVEDRGNYIGVTFDDEEPGTVCNIHPTDDVEYLGMGTTRRVSRSRARYIYWREVANDCCDISFGDFLRSEYWQKAFRESIA